LEQLFLAETATLRIPPLLSCVFLTALWIASLLPGVSSSQRMARFGDAMIVGALLGAIGVSTVLVFVYRDLSAITNLRRMSLWVPLVALYATLMLSRHIRIALVIVGLLITMIVSIHVGAMQTFGVYVLPDSITTFITLTLATAGTAWTFSRYRRGLFDTFARLQVAESQSMTDALTGLPNRRKFRFDSANRVVGSVPHCLIVLDLDQFKRVNDTHGHQAGDTTLTAFADSVSERLPDAATLYRWGGEEFAILAFMPRTDAKVLAESLRRHIEKMVLPSDVRITASFGVTEILPEESVDAAFQRADAALYEAKHAGRNRSVFRAP
jgi:diguanylate cyclase (GGDEF)-like protein